LDLPYLLKKVRFVPFWDLPYYGFRYLWSRLHRFFSRERRLAFWGPRLEGMDQILEQHTLNEVCALQWKRCVDKADEALGRLPAERVIRVQYETFVREPAHELRRILDFLGHDVPQQAVDGAVIGVSAKSLGKGREALGAAEVQRLEMLVGDSLKRYGYV
jgi:hypothetical protein